MDDQNQVYEAENYYTAEPIVVSEVPEPPKGGNGFAITSLVVGILSILLMCCGGCFSVVGGIVGLVFGIISLVQKRQGKGMAIAGVVLSGLAAFLGIIVFIAYIVVSAAGSAY